jgi:hypothetical protein
MRRRNRGLGRGGWNGRKARNKEKEEKRRNRIEEENRREEYSI